MRVSFKMDLFTEALYQYPSPMNSEANMFEKVCKLLDIFFSKYDLPENALEEFTREEFEWFYNVICFWPTWEEYCEIEDVNHFGVQRNEIKDFIQEVAKLPQIRKPVTFI